MNLIEQYLSLTNEGRFNEALPLIEEIVSRNPEIPTSQFNYGICLAELQRHQEADAAFLHAYTLDPNDGGPFTAAASPWPRAATQRNC